MTIILDAMGSDKYPDPEIIGSIEAAGILKEEIILVGNEEVIRPKLEEASPENPYISIVHAPEVVEMWDKPVESARQKPNNSMAVGIQLVKDNKGQAFMTAGNTGGAMFNALRVLGRIKGVQRPALTGIFPTRKGKCIVLDNRRQRRLSAGIPAAVRDHGQHLCAKGTEQSQTTDRPAFKWRGSRQGQ